MKPIENLKRSIRYFILRMSLLGVLVVLGAMSIGTGLVGCSGGDAQAPPPAPAVVVDVARVASLPDYREYVGNVRAMDRVEVRARVRGYLVEQRFADGARVAKGDVLFRIDPEPFQVALAEAKGKLASAHAAASGT